MYKPTTEEDHLALVIADVSGKGIPASLFMMSSKILINDHALMGGTPAEILGRVNKQVNANNDANMFVTVWLGILEISSGKLTTASAGHEYPIININGRYELLKDKHGPRLLTRTMNSLALTALLKPSTLSPETLRRRMYWRASALLLTLLSKKRPSLTA